MTLSAWQFGDLQMFGSDVIVADPAWDFQNYSDASTLKGADLHHEIMTLDAIKALRVGERARSACMLLLWATECMRAQAHAVMSAWGNEHGKFDACQKIWKAQMKLKTIGRKLQPSRRHRVTISPKTADRELLTPEHRQWRLIVCRRTGWRCEWIEDGVRCGKSAATGDRMTADHIVERFDGGALHNSGNGQCLCVAHNTMKGVAARAARRGSG